MSHDCIQEAAILKIFNTLDEINKGIAGLQKEQALTNQFLTGNGQPEIGILSRLLKLEQSVGNLNVLKAQFIAIGAFVGFIASIIITIMK